MFKIHKLPKAKTAFLSVSKSVWSRIAGRHNFKLHYSEPAITDEIIHELLKKNTPDLIIHKAKNEKVYGHDIEIIIQQRESCYIKLGLQAKVMYYHPGSAPYPKVEHEVKDPTNSSSKIYQWDLLDRNAFDRIPFYLFYNGFNKDRYSKLVTSTSTIPMSTIPIGNGCTVLPFRIFKQRFLKTTTTGLKLNVSSASFNYCNIHCSAKDNENAFPWHKLFHPPFNLLREAIDPQVGVKIYEGKYTIDSTLYKRLNSEKKSPSDVDEDFVIDPNFEEYLPKYILHVTENRNGFIEEFLKDQ